MKGILSAVEYMHDKGIVHRDLKPGMNLACNQIDNILINDINDLSQCKIVDFGLSAKFKILSGGMD